MIALSFMSLVLFFCADYAPYVFTTESIIVEMAGKTFRILSATIFFDGLQVCGAAIMRSVGAQVYGLIIEIFGFYMVGIPLGLYLMFKTSWGISGYLIGLTLGCLVIFIVQIIFIYRINWTQEAEKVSRLCFKF